MRDSIRVDGFVPASVLTSQEEHTRFAFQSGQAAFMRNWPYAWAPLTHSQNSRVADRVGVIPFPAAPGGRRSAALGGAQLAINRYSEEPDLAAALITFLTAPEQMLERAQVAGQLPARRSLYREQQRSRRRSRCPFARSGGARRRRAATSHARLHRAVGAAAGAPASRAVGAGRAGRSTSRSSDRDSGPSGSHRAWSTGAMNRSEHVPLPIRGLPFC